MSKLIQTKFMAPTMISKILEKVSLALNQENNREYYLRDVRDDLVELKQLLVEFGKEKGFEV